MTVKQGPCGWRRAGGWLSSCNGPLLLKSPCVQSGFHLSILQLWIVATVHFLYFCQLFPPLFSNNQRDMMTMFLLNPCRTSIFFSSIRVRLSAESQYYILLFPPFIFLTGMFSLLLEKIFFLYRYGA